MPAPLRAPMVWSAALPARAFAWRQPTVPGAAELPKKLALAPIGVTSKGLRLRSTPRVSRPGARSTLRVCVTSPDVSEKTAARLARLSKEAREKAKAAVAAEMQRTEELQANQPEQLRERTKISDGSLDELDDEAFEQAMAAAEAKFKEAKAAIMPPPPKGPPNTPPEPSPTMMSFDDLEELASSTSRAELAAVEAELKKVKEELATAAAREASETVEAAAAQAKEKSFDALEEKRETVEPDSNVPEPEAHVEPTPLTPPPPDADTKQVEEAKPAIRSKDGEVLFTAEQLSEEEKLAQKVALVEAELRAMEAELRDDMDKEGSLDSLDELDLEDLTSEEAAAPPPPEPAAPEPVMAAEPEEEQLIDVPDDHTDPWAAGIRKHLNKRQDALVATSEEWAEEDAGSDCSRWGFWGDNDGGETDERLVLLPSHTTGSFLAGGLINGYYQKLLSPNLKEADTVRVVGGFNQWKHHPFDIELTPSPDDDDQNYSESSCFTWMHFQILVPEMSYEMNFVFTDGVHYDNNDRQDFIIQIDMGPTPEEFEEFMVDEETRLKLEEEERERAEREAERKRKQEEVYSAALEETTHEAELEVRALYAKAGDTLDLATSSFEGVWYTEPEVATAGRALKVFYQQGSDHLEWANEVYSIMAINGWTRRRDMGKQMTKSKLGKGLWEMDIVVPEDAIVVNMVFRDQDHNFDNNKDLDYHMLVDPELTMEDRIQMKIGETAVDFGGCI